VAFDQDDVEINIVLNHQKADEQAERIRRGLELMGKEAGTSAQNISKLDKEMAKFGEVTERIAKTAKFTGLKELDRGIKEAFSQKNILSAQQLSDRLYDIGAAATKMGAPLDLVSKRIADLGTQSQKAGSSFSSLQTKLTSIASANYLFQQAIGYVQQLGAALDKAGRTESLERAFSNLQISAGADPSQSISNLRSATQGLISDVELYQKANQAVLLGLPTKGFDELAGAAVKLGRAMGIDATQAVDSLTVGIGRESKMILDNLGIVFSVEEAHKRYAASMGIVGRELTDAEGKLASYQLAQERILQKAAQLPDINDTAATSFSKVTVAVENASKAFLEGINSSVSLSQAFQQMQSTLTSPAFITGLKEVGEQLAGIASTALQIAQIAAVPITITVKTVGAVAQAGQDTGDFIGDLLGLPKVGAGKTDNALLSLGRTASSVFNSLADQAQKQFEKLRPVADKALKSVQEGLKKSTVESKKFTATQDPMLKSFEQLSSAIDDVVGINALPEVVYQVEQLYKNASGVEQIAAGMRKIGEESIKAGKKVGDVVAALRQGKDNSGEVVSASYDASDTRTPADVLGGAPKRASTKEDVGQFFGFDIEGMAQQLQSEIASALGDAIAQGVNAAFGNGDFGLPQAQQLVGSIGSSIANYYAPGTGPIADALLQNIVGLFGSSDTAGTTARKSVDRYFADMFDANRLAVIINGQIARIDDLVMNPADSLFGGEGTSFGDGTFDDMFAQLPAQAQTAFSGVGAAFEQLLGVGEDMSGQLAAIIFNNIGGSLQNLQVLVQTTGYSFEQLGDAIFESFFNGTLSIDQAYSSLAALQDLFTDGIPGALGAIDQAFSNFQTALADGRGSRQLLDSLRDIGAEANELGVRDFPTLAQRLISNFGFSTSQVATLFEAMKASGISSIQQLVDASNAQLLTVAQNVNNINSGAATVTAPIDPLTIKTPATNFAPASYPKGPAAKKEGSKGLTDAEKEAKAARQKAEQEAKRLADETYRLFSASEKYKDILDQVNKGMLTNVDAGQQVKALYDEIATKNKALTALELELQNKIQGKTKLQSAQNAVEKASIDLQKAKAKGSKADKDGIEAAKKALDEAKKKLKEIQKDAKDAGKSVGDLSIEVSKAQNDLKELTNKPEKETKALSKLDLSPLKSLLLDLNRVGIAATSLGVGIDKTVDIIVTGFRAGQLSIADANREIEKTKELLGKGIPGAIGAVDVAFENILRGGTKGGAFSLDAVGDLFAEAEEKFLKGRNGKRNAERDRLTSELDSASAAFNTAAASGAAEGEGVGAFNDRLDYLRDKLSGAKKALDDFNTTLPKMNLEDFRSILQDSGIDANSVNAIFRTIYDSGFSTFDELKNASEPQIIAILDQLQKLGVPFKEADADVTKFNEGLNSVINPLQEVGEGVNKHMVDPVALALKGVRDFLAETTKLPPAFADDGTGINVFKNSIKDASLAFYGNADSVTAAMGATKDKLAEVSGGVTELLSQLSLIEAYYEVGVTFKVNSEFNNDVTQAIAQVTVGDIVTPGGGSGDSGVSDNANASRTAKRITRLKFLIKNGRRKEAEESAKEWGMNLRDVT
jgi:hypothetical protein